MGRKGRNNGLVADSPDPQPARPRGGARLSVALTLLLLLVFGVQWFRAGFPLLEGAGLLEYDELRSMGGLEVRAVRDEGQWWRLVTGALLHGAWWHAALNVWAWVSLAPWVELRHGTRSLAWLVGLSALASGAAALSFSSAPMVVGVSGVVFGVGGYLVAQNARSGFGDFPRRQLAFWLGLTVLLGVFWDGLSQAGHLGGLGAGLALGLARRSGSRSSYLSGMFGVIWFSLGCVYVSRDSESTRRAVTWAWVSEENWDRAADRLSSELGSRRVLDADVELLNAVAYGLALEGRRLGEAERFADEALGGLPGDSNILDTRGWIACRAGRSLEGQEFIRLALESGSAENEEILGHLTECESAAVDLLSRG